MRVRSATPLGLCEGCNDHARTSSRMVPAHTAPGDWRYAMRYMGICCEIPSTFLYLWNFSELNVEEYKSRIFSWHCKPRITPRQSNPHWWMFLAIPCVEIHKVWAGHGEPGDGAEPVSCYPGSSVLALCWLPDKGWPSPPRFALRSAASSVAPSENSNLLISGKCHGHEWWSTPCPWVRWELRHYHEIRPMK